MRNLSPLLILAFFCLPANSQTACEGMDCPLAIRGTATVTVADLVAKLDSIEARHRPLLLSDGKQLENIVENMLLQRQIAQDLKATELESDPVMVAKLQQARDAVLSVARLDEIRAARLPKNFDALAREHFLISKADYIEPRSVRVRHLLIATEKRTDAEALELATEIARRLPLNDQEAFAKAVVESSEDPGKASNQGEYLVAEGNTQYDPAFSTASLGLVRVGSMTTPVKSQFGYHLIQLLEDKPARQMTFEEAKPQLVAIVSGDARRRIVSEYRNELSIAGDLKIYPENLPQVDKLIEGRQ